MNTLLLAVCKDVPQGQCAPLCRRFIAHVRAVSACHPEEYINFERCMVKILKALQFPAKAGRKDVVIKISFILG
jgi:hypothetical protein